MIGDKENKRENDCQLGRAEGRGADRRTDKSD